MHSPNKIYSKIKLYRVIVYFVVSLLAMAKETLCFSISLVGFGVLMRCVTQHMTRVCGEPSPRDSMSSISGFFRGSRLDFNC